MDENRNNVATMLNRSSDLRGRMKLAKFRLFIYAKLKPNKIHRNMYISVESPESENQQELCVFWKYQGQFERNYELVSDMCFSLILVNVSYFL